jgi:hypothetical protein
MTEQLIGGSIRLDLPSSREIASARRRAAEIVSWSASDFVHHNFAGCVLGLGRNWGRAAPGSVFD